ncbi:hypothetical protein LSAT2_005116 [Lamellibrachia satsuma]|nr:hypothetical protein LSAT2_005116 [Lamellibrachia satsuma]
MISFSSDSDSSPQLPCPRSKLHQQTYGEKSLCDQKHQHLTERRTKCKKREASSSEPGSTLMDRPEFDAGSTQNCEKVKSGRAETMQNCAGTTEDDTKPKNNSARTTQKGANNHHQITRAPLGSIKKQNTDLHGLFDVSSGSDSSSEFDATSVSVTCLMNGDASGSDSEDFGGLSDQLAQVLSISTCRRMPRKQPKRRGEDAMPGKENASLAAEGELGSLHDQRPLLKSKRKNLSKNSKKSSNGTCSPDPTCHKLHVGLGKTPAGCADESNRSGTSDFSVNDDEVLPETKEISLQVSLSANSETSPETSIGDGSVRSKTASTPEEIFDRREDSENCMSKKVTTRHSEEDSLCSVEEGMHVEAMSQHDSLHSEDISHNDGITTDFIDNEIEPTTRDFSLQVSIGSTELSDSEYDLSLPENYPSDNRQHLPTVQNCSLQVSMSSSNATDSLLVFPGGEENGQAVSIGDGKCLPSTNSEKMRFCQAHMTSCDSDANLKKQLFPGSTLQSPVHYRGLSPSMWDSGFGEMRCSTASDKGTHKTQASFGTDKNRSEGASYIDHSVDKTNPPRLSLSPEDSSHDNHVGTSKDRKDQDLDNEWLPDLDSSSDESDLEAFFQEMKTPKIKKDS